MTLRLANLGEAVTAESFLGQLPEAARTRLLEDADVVDIERGATIFSASEARDRIGIIIHGIARTHLNAPDGRRLSVRFARTGDTIGSITAERAGLSAQAVTDCTILRLDGHALGELIAEDGRVGLTFIVEMSRRLVDTYATLAANTFGTMRERVARQLLDIAMETRSPVGLVAPLTQQDLADSVGTVREVVARVLREFRDEGLVQTEPSRIVINDPDGLAAIVERWSANER